MSTLSIVIARAQPPLSSGKEGESFLFNKKFTNKILTFSDFGLYYVL